MEQSRKEQTKVPESTTDRKKLVVFNDDFNTFKHVTATLIQVCNHNPDQAEQCTWIIHHKGRCTVKEGPVEILQPMCRLICDVGIRAKVI